MFMNLICISFKIKLKENASLLLVLLDTTEVSGIALSYEI